MIDIFRVLLSSLPFNHPIDLIEEKSAFTDGPKGFEGRKILRNSPFLCSLIVLFCFERFQRNWIELIPCLPLEASMGRR